MSAVAQPEALATWDTTYLRLPARFYAPLAPTQVANPHLIRVNQGLAGPLKVDAEGLTPGAAAAIFAGAPGVSDLIA